MNKEEEFNKLTDFFKNIPENFNILEEQIDLDTQQEFFELSQNINRNKETLEIKSLIEVLYSSNSEMDIKTALIQLAEMDAIEAYQAIVKYKNQDTPYKMWATLAEQQCRMVLQSSIIDEEQVFISTGLGGKGSKLRFFLIFPLIKDNPDAKTIHKRLQGELEFTLSKHQGEIEEMEMHTNFATALCLIPIKAPIPEIVTEVLDECAQLGLNLSNNVMITNMKKFSEIEIEQIIEENKRNKKV